jgi:transposase-like protein
MALAGVKRKNGKRRRPETPSDLIARIAGGERLDLKGRHKSGERYTTEQRRVALVALAANGGDVPATADQLGIPDDTLYQWRVKAEQSDAIAENTLRMSESERRDRIVARSEDWGQLWGEAEAEALARIRQVLPLTTNVRDLAILAGISADKRMDHYYGRKGQNVPAGTMVDARTVAVHLHGLNPTQESESAKLSQAAGVLAEVARRIGVGQEATEPFTTSTGEPAESIEATAVPDSVPNRDVHPRLKLDLSSSTPAE